MNHRPYSNNDKNIISIISGLTFLLTSSPFSFRIYDKITSYFNVKSVNEKDNKTISGILFGSIIFMILILTFITVKEYQLHKKYKIKKDHLIVVFICGLLYTLISCIPYQNNEKETINRTIINTLLFTIIVRVLIR